MAADLQGRPLEPKAARKLLLRQLRKARACLRARPGDEQIHSARKHIKKARALLRMLEPSLGRRTWRRGEAALRAAARPLSAVRDAKIMTDTFEQLLKSRARVLLKGRRRLAASLARHHRETRAAVVREPGGLAAACRSLRRATRTLDAPLNGGRRALLRSPGKLYRAGRRQLLRNQCEPAVDTLHAWRKCSKYLYHQLEVLATHCPPETSRLARAFHALSDDLGEDHDLALLRAHVALHPESLPDPEEREDLVRLIEEARLERQQRVFRSAAQLYARRPRDFRAVLENGCRRAPVPAP